jgi:hypothetical protein
MDPAQIQEMMANMPKAKGFWQTHLGTDMLVASWMFVIFSVIYVLICCLYLKNGYDSYSADDGMDYSSKMVYYWCALIASLGYLVGAVFFVKFSYPDSFSEMFDLNQDTVDAMSTTEKYFTGTAFLKGIWFFYLASVPFLVSSMYTIFHEPEDEVGYEQLGFTLFLFAGMGVWLIACSMSSPRLVPFLLLVTSATLICRTAIFLVCFLFCFSFSFSCSATLFGKCLEI